jgi:hypothetical protein
MRRTCEESLVEATLAPVMGVDFRALCGDARRVEFTPLPDDDKVRVSADAVLLHDACVRGLDAGPETAADAASLCALYLIHELVHLPQGIGPYPMVGRLRTLGEDALLDLDLGADHVSALVVARTNRVDLGALKTLQLRGLCGFPVSPEHTPEARRRKARRVVGLVAEAKLGMLSENGYLVADFSPESSELVLIRRGTGVTRVVAAPPLTRGDVDRLLSAADPRAAGGASPDELAAILNRVLIATESAA